MLALIPPALALLALIVVAGAMRATLPHYLPLARDIARRAMLEL